jgi:hypothetical protein
MLSVTTIVFRNIKIYNKNTSILSGDALFYLFRIPLKKIQGGTHKGVRRSGASTYG